MVILFSNIMAVHVRMRNLLRIAAVGVRYHVGMRMSMPKTQRINRRDNGTGKHQHQCDEILRRERLCWKGLGSVAAFKAGFIAYMQFCNYERPHAALNYKSPINRPFRLNSSKQRSFVNPNRTTRAHSPLSVRFVADLAPFWQRHIGQNTHAKCRRSMRNREK